MITEELKQKNFNFFKKRLESIGVDTTKLVERLGDKLINATFAINNDFNCAYDGSLLNVVLRILTPHALKINEILPEEIRVDTASLIKVCMLSQISKSIMFVKNDNVWEIENRKILYKYGKYDYALKMGMRSLILAQECGITFTEGEIEAMVSSDKLSDDKQNEFYSGIMSVILRQASELTYFELKNINKNEQNGIKGN